MSDTPLRLTCACGAELVTSTWSSGHRGALIDQFHEAHLACRSWSLGLGIGTLEPEDSDPPKTTQYDSEVLVTFSMAPVAFHNVAGGDS